MLVSQLVILIGELIRRFPLIISSMHLYACESYWHDTPFISYTFHFIVCMHVCMKGLTQVYLLPGWRNSWKFAFSFLYVITLQERGYNQFPPTREANSEAPKAHSSSSGGIGSGVSSRIGDETWVGKGEGLSQQSLERHEAGHHSLDQSSYLPEITLHPGSRPVTIN